MPARNTIKQYVANGFYHIYNRGVEKRSIFLDKQDYGVFLGYLREYLLPKDTDALQKSLIKSNISYKEKAEVIKALRLNNFHDEITLHTYCLKPNHFHFLVKQNSPDSIDRFMNSLCTRYSMYINKKYKRVGTLFQDVYKAVLVLTDEQLLQLSKYIHRQALSRKTIQPSSYPEYQGLRNTPWIVSQEILAYFSKTNQSSDYKSFIQEEQDLEVISKLILEN